MDGRCERHNFEAAVGICDHCGDEFCGECLLHPFGEKRPPLCIPCTIANSGLRAGNARPKRKKLSRKERKALAASGGAANLPAAPASSSPAPVPVIAADDDAGSGDDGGKRGRRGRRKGKDADDSPTTIPTPVASDDAEGDGSALPAGAGMPAAGAEQIDWSKPFEFNS